MVGRYYKIDGERFASVTTILGVLDKSGLAQWRGSVGNDEADRIATEAAEHGTAIHGYVERFNRGDRGPYGPPIDTIVQPYIAWHNAQVSCVLAAEKLVVSRRFKFAGTADVVVMLTDGTLAVVDLKTSKSALSEDTWSLQLAAYSLALEEEDVEARRRIVVRLPKSSPGALYTLEFPEDTLETDQRAFLSALRLYRWRSERAPAREETAAKRIQMTTTGRRVIPAAGG
jgi:hypothetical protein